MIYDQKTTVKDCLSKNTNKSESLGVNIIKHSQVLSMCDFGELLSWILNLVMEVKMSE